MQRVPLTPGTEDEENGIHGLTIINAGAMAPHRVQLPWGKQRLEAFPQLVRQAPITMCLLLVGIPCTGSCGREFLPTGYHPNSLLG